MKRIFKHINILLIALATINVGCSDEAVDDFFKKIVKAPPSHIERDVKGHDQIYSVHAILRMGFKGGQIGVGINGDELVNVYNVYETMADSLSLPIRQEIDMSRNEDGEITITTQRDHFDVIASDEIYYGLELIYYDMNGKPINHQFSSLPWKKSADNEVIPDPENSTLMVHQHFFGIGSSSLKRDSGVTVTHDQRQLFDQGNTTLQMAFPRTLEETPHYYNRYTFRQENGEGIRASKFSLNNVYVPMEKGFKPDELQVPFNNELAWESIRRSGKPASLDKFNFKGSDYWLYKSVDYMQLNKLTHEIFTYEYRDTDPVDKYLGYFYDEHSNDDFIDKDGMARDRYGNTVGLLRQKRTLTPEESYDHLGFKGMLQFKQANMAFQLQVKICHILNKVARGDGREYPAKYGNKDNAQNGFVWNFDQLQNGWDSFDIDYPLSIRVIGNTKDGKDKCMNDILKIYPKADKTQLEKMLFNPSDYFSRYRHDRVFM